MALNIYRKLHYLLPNKGESVIFVPLSTQITIPLTIARIQMNTWVMLQNLWKITLIKAIFMTTIGIIGSTFK